ncbi:MAG: DUF2786 domain-containing protein [Pseudonocardia sp.]
MSTPASLLERVRKLLAQAEDAGVTAAEAEAFNAKAAELIARHGIDAAHLAATGRTRDDIGHRVIVVEQPYARDKAQLLTSVSDALRCQTVHTIGDHYTVRVYGFGSDLERVELLYTSLLVQAVRDLVHVRPDTWGESTAAYRRSWLAGFTTAVYTRLLRAEQRATTEQPATSNGTSTALVLRDRTDQVAAHVATAHPKLRSMRRRALSGSGRTDGYHSGARADLGARRVGHTRALPR